MEGDEAETKEMKTEEECSSPQGEDLEFVSCLLQPPMAHHDADYVARRRLLLHCKASSLLDRKDWRCNNRSYVAYRSFIRRPRNWESQTMTSQLSTPSNRLVSSSIIDPPTFSMSSLVPLQSSFLLHPYVDDQLSNARRQCNWRTLAARGVISRQSCVRSMPACRLRVLGTTLRPSRACGGLLTHKPRCIAMPSTCNSFLQAVHLLGLCSYVWSPVVARGVLERNK
ncbi:hypothetical protein AXF42_Ash005865 [Apostasia shenzhenica]|uniref:Uncharacterized protein n=1 Tax=Apostasia shenzhenica TaxID=1088818 RepID=A0A2I0BCK3_9ASPA|nr:hypothetical protein AXF42_Ash005865 [Apostasia shenzhenica]